MHPERRGAQEAAGIQSVLGRGGPRRGERFFRPHYVSWSEQQRIEAAAPIYLRNVVRIITEIGLRIYKELAPIQKDQVDLENKIVWISDSKTPNGVGEVPLTDLAVEALRDQIQLAGRSPYLFPGENAVGHQTTFKTAWRLTFVERRCRTFACTICARPMRRA
jgi:integrase